MPDSDRLSPFSYVILVLVGKKGAGPHDLRRDAEQGRVLWQAATSQWYAEPKRLERLGYLTARKEPGRTRERTHYELTDRGLDAIAAWVRTPVPLPRMQHENVVRLLAADLVGPDTVLEGLRPLLGEIELVEANIEMAVKRFADEDRSREEILSVNGRYALALAQTMRDWLNEVERVLRRGT